MPPAPSTSICPVDHDEVRPLVHLVVLELLAGGQVMAMLRDSPRDECRIFG